MWRSIAALTVLLASVLVPALVLAAGDRARPDEATFGQLARIIAVLLGSLTAGLLFVRPLARRARVDHSTA
ncbi:MAG: hypothetical protein M3N29_03310 [Chloroflexota bacterium]|nr:hypothetical protein [Chloroflexota bacterium]